MIWAHHSETPITWMDSVHNKEQFTKRQGYLVEINALWYDAIQFFLELAKENKDKKFIGKWGTYAERIKNSFKELFWNEKKGYLADYVDEQGANWDIRPNMIFAISEGYSPLKEYQKEYILKLIHDELFISKGLRTLSPKSIKYKGKYEGSVLKRDKAYHQGTAWPWLLGPFAEAYIKLHPQTGKKFIEKIYHGFDDEMKNQGIGTISEIYDGNPPYEARGSISYAASVAEMLRIGWMIENGVEMLKTKSKG